MRILVLAGGDTDEREVSLRSGSSVSDALKAAGHQVSLFDPAHAELASAVAAEYDVAFPVIHGKGGEDGELQQQLEDIGLAYVGSDVAGSKLCFDKWAYRNKLLTTGIDVAQGEMVDIEAFWQSPLTRQGFVLKPQRSGSTIDTLIVRDAGTLDNDEIGKLFEKYGTMLLEKLIEGNEITVTVLGEQVLPVIEIVPPEHSEYDYENKYNNDNTQLLCPPQHVGADIQRAAQDLTLRIHRLCECRDLSRTDMIVTTAGELVVLETNTLPGMTDHSLVPLAARTSGIPMPDLCDRLAQMAFKRRAV